MQKDQLLNNVAKKTNVNKNDILKLANDLQSKNLSDEGNIRDLIKEVAKLAGREVSKEKEEKIVSLVKNDKIPSDLNNIVK